MTPSVASPQSEGRSPRHPIGLWPERGRVHGRKLIHYPSAAVGLDQPANRKAPTRLDPSQWKSARTTNAIERLNGEFRRRINTQTVLPCAETVPILLWALLASGQIQMRKVDGWETLSQPMEPMPLDLAA